MRKAVSGWIGLLVLVASTAHAAAGEEPQAVSGNQVWQGLKGRMALGTAAQLRSEIAAFDADPQKINSLSLMGDYYFTRPWLGSAGGLRATSGLLLGSRTSLWSSPSAIDRRNTGPGSGLYDNENQGADTLPYLGVGYTGLSSKGEWGISADLGLMATTRSGVRLGRVFNGSQSLDDSMRDLRFLPLLQVGVSYSF